MRHSDNVLLHLITATAILLASIFGSAHGGWSFLADQTECKILCENGGVCSYNNEDPTRHKCICFIGMYWGDRCENVVREPASDDEGVSKVTRDSPGTFSSAEPELGIVHDDDNDDSFEVSDVLSSTEQMGGGESNFKAMEVKDDRRTVYSEAVLNPTDVREQQQQQQFKAVDSEEEEVERAGQDRSPKSEMAATKGYEAMTPNTDEQRQFLLPNKAAVIGGGGPQQFVETNDRLLDAEFVDSGRTPTASKQQQQPTRKRPLARAQPTNEVLEENFTRGGRTSSSPQQQKTGGGVTRPIAPSRTRLAQQQQQEATYDDDDGDGWMLSRRGGGGRRNGALAARQTLQQWWWHFLLVSLLLCLPPLVSWSLHQPQRRMLF